MRNPNKTFVVVGITRDDIANCLNEEIMNEGLDVDIYEPDDQRLTKKVCQDIADQLGDIYDDDLSEEDRGDAQREVFRNAALFIRD